jgi:hypothetical protein
MHTFYLIDTGDISQTDPQYAARFGDIVDVTSSRSDADDIANYSLRPLVAVAASRVRRARGRAWTNAYDPILGDVLYGSEEVPF